MKKFMNIYTIFILFVMIIGAIILGTVRFVSSKSPSIVQTSLKEYPQENFSSQENKAIQVAIKNTEIPSNKTHITVIQAPDAPTQYFVTFKQSPSGDSGLWVRVDVATDKVLSVDTGGI
jgi:hypothetical protein